MDWRLRRCVVRKRNQVQYGFRLSFTNYFIISLWFGFHAAEAVHRRFVQFRRCIGMGLANAVVFLFGFNFRSCTNFCSSLNVCVCECECVFHFCFPSLISFIRRFVHMLDAHVGIASCCQCQFTEWLIFWSESIVSLDFLILSRDFPCTLAAFSFYFLYSWATCTETLTCTESASLLDSAQQKQLHSGLNRCVYRLQPPLYRRQSVWNDKFIHSNLLLSFIRFYTHLYGYISVAERTRANRHRKNCITSQVTSVIKILYQLDLYIERIQRSVWAEQCAEGMRVWRIRRSNRKYKTDSRSSRRRRRRYLIFAITFSVPEIWS